MSHLMYKWLPHCIYPSLQIANTPYYLYITRTCASIHLYSCYMYIIPLLQIPLTANASHYNYLSIFVHNANEDKHFHTFPSRCKCLCHYKCLSKLRMSLQITDFSQRHTCLSKLQISLKYLPHGKYLIANAYVATNISQRSPSLQLLHYKCLRHYECLLATNVSLATDVSLATVSMGWLWLVGSIKW